ncbi:Hypothetical predicted protein [Octopus vulgaris]|uniref:Uncharacterized protein n=1 Tax=Octopus vulgaris TaxID=6645 RepID=A0AA36EX31_OCTVU|nr:Hypothetical predicted protein [Octopus vulgaris]
MESCLRCQCCRKLLKLLLIQIMADKIGWVHPHYIGSSHGDIQRGCGSTIQRMRNSKSEICNLLDKCFD